MRKYRPMFAPAEARPDALALYGRLYELLRKQGVALGLKRVDRPGAVAANPVVGRWLHGAQGMRDGEGDFREDGTIEQGGQIIGLWAMADGRLMLRWPNPKARGGIFVDVVQLAPDGNRYEGTNQDGTQVHGQRIGDARSAAASPAVAKDGLRPGRVWRGVGRFVYPADFAQAMTAELEITRRDGDEFEGVTRFDFGKTERFVKGSFSAGMVSYETTRVVKGAPLNSPTTGVISDDRMALEVLFTSSNGRKAHFKMYLKLVGE